MLNNMNEIIILVAGIPVGILIGFYIGYKFTLKMFYKDVIESPDVSLGVKNVARKLSGKPTKAKYMPQMTDTEAMKNEENSSSRHSELVVINEEQDE